MQYDKSFLKAKDLAQTNLLFCSPETTLLETAKIVTQNKVSSILIRDSKENIIGIWTESDAKKIDFSDSQYSCLPVAQFMSSPLQCISADLNLPEILLAFTKNRVRHLLVQDEHEHIIGIVSQSDVFKRQGVEYYLKSRKIGDNYDERLKLLDGDQNMNALVKQMAHARSSASLVLIPQTNEVGIITERDIVKLMSNNEPMKAAWCYASYPVVSLSVEDSLLNAYVLLKSNHIRHLVVKDTQGQVRGLLSLENILADIEFAHLRQLEDILVEREVALASSKKSLMLAEHIINASPDGIVVTDAKSNIIEVNPAFTRITGYTAEEAVGKTTSLLSSGRHDASFYADMWQQLQVMGRYSGEIWNKKKDGEIYLEYLNIVRIGDPSDPDLHYAAIFTDITEKRDIELKIQSMAFYDELTGLPNRRLFNDRLDNAIANSRVHQHKLAILFLDLDRFKQINDTLGHKHGDELLKTVAKRIASSIKAGDTVSRLGGDEFVILLPEIGEDSNVIAVIDRIISVINEPFDIGGQELYVTCSIGASTYPEDGQSADDLLINADIAMYKAKSLGRNNYQIFHQDLNIETQNKALLQNKLILAVKNQEFNLNFQFQYNIEQKSVASVEALLRWHNLELGVVSPAQFIPLAEELGIIVDIERFVLLEACKVRKSWLDNNINCGRIAVNISAKHFKVDLVESVKQSLQQSGLPAELLEIEVTESCFIEDFENTKAVLQQIKALGVKVALDDFGTGYSSLSYLTQLPIDVLKIDASFIAHVPQNEKESKLVSLICSMAQGLGLEIVAEGVENEQQAIFLMKNQCSVFQGFLYNRPQPANLTKKELIKYHQRLLRIVTDR